MDNLSSLRAKRDELTAYLDSAESFLAARTGDDADELAKAIREARRSVKLMDAILSLSPEPVQATPPKTPTQRSLRFRAPIYMPAAEPATL